MQIFSSFTLFQFLLKINLVLMMISKIGCIKNKPTTFSVVPTKQQHKLIILDLMRRWVGIQGTFKGNFNSMRMVKGRFVFQTKRAACLRVLRW